MSKKYSWEENNKRYAEIKETLEAKGDGKRYCPCYDSRGLQMRIISRTSDEKHSKKKGNAEGGFEYHPLVRSYSLHNVLLVIVLIMYSQNVLSFKIYVLYIIH